MSRRVDVAIIGAGSAGVSALRTVRQFTDNYLLIDGGALGTSCARVGCMPSKSLIETARLFERRYRLKSRGITGTEHLSVHTKDVLEQVRSDRDFFTQTTANLTDELSKNHFLQGYARFDAPNQLDVDGKKIECGAVIVATGTQAYVPAHWQSLGHRLLVSDWLFEQTDLPHKLGVVGLGAIGLEVGQALAHLGHDVVGVDLADALGGAQDPAIIKVAHETIGRSLPMHTGHHVALSDSGDGVSMQFGDHRCGVDNVIVAVGRTPNVANLNLQALGVPLNTAGVPESDPQTCQIGDLPVFIAGDVSVHQPLQHEAIDEGAIAGFNAVCADIRAYRRRVPLKITFTDPQIAQFGCGYGSLDLTTTVIGQALMADNGRARISGMNAGLIRLYANRAGLLLGGELLCDHAEHMAHLLAWQITHSATVASILRQPFYHPVVEEAIRSALRTMAKKLYKNHSVVEWQEPILL
ncbi:Dihydrolipoyl dehydrogenase [BD1-7 clade bacterium]|uniref:Dihydrolipoyl dehydrogenase n=1 Tax=BD1-7 clade bacterium TaxID=2029982 RepID=A0A5S9QHY1_9GAMM|nr:Dihydrolipoyl dehydrogenase [BD1-7 clade bacterium]CAA0117200.1 Dihydrolipoyl dehydrogenase [BD1-7 clade bacterium]